MALMEVRRDVEERLKLWGEGKRSSLLLQKLFKSLFKLSDITVASDSEDRDHQRSDLSGSIKDACIETLIRLEATFRDARKILSVSIAEGKIPAITDRANTSPSIHLQYSSPPNEITKDNQISNEYTKTEYSERQLTGTFS